MNNLIKIWKDDYDNQTKRLVAEMKKKQQMFNDAENLQKNVQQEYAQIQEQIKSLTVLYNEKKQSPEVKT